MIEEAVVTSAVPAASTTATAAAIPAVKAATVAAAPATTAAAIPATAVVPAAKIATAVTVPTAKAAGVTAALKGILLSPMFGIVALGGIIAFEIWQSKRDIRKVEQGK
mgnify:CR=1 FL=1